MPTTHQVFSFAIAAFIIIIIPGPSVLFVIGRGISLGRRAALATVFGNAVGATVCAALVSFGLGPVISRSVTFFTVMKIVGALYLVSLGWKSFRDRRKLAAVLDATVVSMGTRRIIAQGFIVGITNPKIYVFFAAVLPQYVEPDSGSTWLQMIILGLVFSAIALVSDSMWGLLAGSVRQWVARSPKRLEAIGGLGGLAVMGLGVRLALTGRSN